MTFQKKTEENATNVSPWNLTAYSIAQYYLLRLEIYHFILMTSGTSAKKHSHGMDHTLDTSWITFEVFFWSQL